MKHQCLSEIMYSFCCEACYLTQIYLFNFQVMGPLRHSSMFSIPTLPAQFNSLDETLYLHACTKRIAVACVEYQNDRMHYCGQISQSTKQMNDFMHQWICVIITINMLSSQAAHLFVHDKTKWYSSPRTLQLRQTHSPKLICCHRPVTITRWWFWHARNRQSNI